MSKISTFREKLASFGRTGSSHLQAVLDKWWSQDASLNRAGAASKVWKVVHTNLENPIVVGSIEWNPISNNYTVRKHGAMPAFPKALPDVGFFGASRNEKRDLRKALDMLARNLPTFSR